jgi:hypothetical protein
VSVPCRLPTREPRLAGISGRARLGVMGRRVPASYYPSASFRTTGSSRRAASSRWGRSVAPVRLTPRYKSRWPRSGYRQASQTTPARWRWTVNLGKTVRLCAESRKSSKLCVRAGVATPSRSPWRRARVFFLSQGPQRDSHGSSATASSSRRAGGIFVRACPSLYRGKGLGLFVGTAQGITVPESGSGKPQTPERRILAPPSLWSQAAGRRRV